MGYLERVLYANQMPVLPNSPRPVLLTLAVPINIAMTSFISIRFECYDGECFEAGLYLCMRQQSPMEILFQAKIKFDAKWKSRSLALSR